MPRQAGHTLDGFPVGPGDSWGEPVDVVATTNVTVSGLNAGDTLDGVTLKNWMRVLLTGQSDATENGVYLIGQTAPARRAPDCCTPASIFAGKSYRCTRGTYAGRVWTCATTDDIAVGTTSIVWSPDVARPSGLRPAAAIAETIDRASATLSNASVLATGRMQLAAIHLSAGQVVTSATFYSATTALSAGSNQWFALFDSAFAKLRVTSDDTSTAWAATTAKTLTFSSTYTVPTTGIYYLGIVVVASTVPTLVGISSVTNSSAVLLASPILGGRSDSSLTNPASCPSTATTPSTGLGDRPYAIVS